MEPRRTTAAVAITYFMIKASSFCVLRSACYVLRASFLLVLRSDPSGGKPGHGDQRVLRNRPGHRDHDRSDAHYDTATRRNGVRAVHRFVTDGNRLRFLAALD